ncbi:MAG: polymerase, sigma-24 subunit, subfamily [Verrucomicrobiales bacterium]|nr:polymerase, sigma-24 subunit, subfamily [Verrucomicrobiales bacterium]
MPPPDCPSSDHDLLERHLRGGDPQAFTELVRRHLTPVYSAALRICGNPTLAEEASQSVFSRLASLRRALPEHLPLNVWLHRTVRSASLNLLRSEGRRRLREHTFAILQTMSAANDPFPWEGIAPILDEVLERLPAGERSLLLSRFFESRPHSDIAAELHLSEDAVRMRIKRALERMRGFLAKRGIHTTASALAAGLPAHACVPVAPALAASIPAAALTAPAAISLLNTLSAALMTQKTIAAVTTVLLLAGAGSLMFLKSPSADNGRTGARNNPRRLSAGTDGPSGKTASSPAAEAARAPGTAEPGPRPGARDQWLDTEKLSRPLRENIASSTVSTSLKKGESLVTGGYRTRGGSHEITFLTPRSITLEDGRGAVELSAQVVLMRDAALAAAGLETIATNARNAEAWQAGEMEAFRAGLGKMAEGEAGISTAPKVIALPSQPFSVQLSEADGAVYTLEAVVELADSGGFMVKSRIERSEAPVATPESAVRGVAPETARGE